MIKYLGSKRLLLPHITKIIMALNPVSMIDLFAGTSRVGHEIKKNKTYVIANDHNEYAHNLALTYVQADKEWYGWLQEELDYYNSLPGEKGWFTKNYCEDSMFFQPHNGAKIEQIRNIIEKDFITKEPKLKNVAKEIKAVLTTSLIEAADRVDNTCGIQMAYLKSWCKRSYNDLELRPPELVDGLGLAIKMDALEAAKLPHIDVAYIDPPYNQHSYLGNYHIWETICLWDNPEVYGKAKKRIDVKERKSDFNSKIKILNSFKSLINNLSTRAAVVSFNNEGYLTKDEIYYTLKEKYPHVSVLEIPYQRYVGSKIGIHNKSGEKVGKVSHTENIEYIFVAKV